VCDCSVCLVLKGRWSCGGEGEAIVEVITPQVAYDSICGTTFCHLARDINCILIQSHPNAATAVCLSQAHLPTLPHSHTLPHPSPQTSIPMSTSSANPFTILEDDPATAPSNESDEVDSLPSTESRTSLDEDEDDEDARYDSDAEREWRESLQQLELMLTIVVVPYIGKYFGRKCAYWGEFFRRARIDEAQLTDVSAMDRLGQVHGVEASESRGRGYESKVVPGGWGAGSGCVDIGWKSDRVHIQAVALQAFWDRKFCQEQTEQHSWSLGIHRCYTSGGTA
jgi:hypothetical protein